jgi:hypothetical protein
MSIEDDRLERLKKKLYSNDEDELQQIKRVRLQKHSVLVDNDWEDDEEKASPAFKLASTQSDVPDRGSTYKKVLGISLLLFFGAVAFLIYTFFAGTNAISNTNIDIRLIGPVSSPAGEELPLDIDITNTNNVDLILADLVVSYPEGTRSPADRTTPMPTERIPVGTISKGQTIRQKIKPILFGEEGTVKNIALSLEYRVDGSSNIFVKEKNFPISIGTSPITMNVESVKEIIPEQEAEFRVTIKSNSTAVIRGLVFKAEYPFGFEFTGSTPVASVSDDTWVIGDMLPGEERKITVRGRLLGGDAQERVIRFFTGTEDPKDKTEIATVFVTNSKELTLKKPFLSLDMTLDGKTASTYIARSGHSVKGEITWQNNLNVPLNDIVMEVKINGQLLDRSTVEGDRGYYRSVDNTILWDRSTLEDLKEVVSKGSGRIQFNFNTLAATIKNSTVYRNPSLTLDLTVRAKRLNEDRVPEEIVSTISRNIKVASDLSLSSRIVHSIGPFDNTGPMPTRPDEATTYTVLVSVANSFNSVKDTVYTATLPSYVSWTGKYYPENANVKYNADKREVTWTIGDVAPGTGYSSSLKEFAYQISFLPSIGQMGTAPMLVGPQKVMAKDMFTGTIIDSVLQPLDTKIERDPAFSFGDEKVGGK